MKDKSTKVRLVLNVKGTDIELSPAEARELVQELAKLTGQTVDAAPVVLPAPYPVYERRRYWPYFEHWTWSATGDKVETVWSSTDSSVSLKASVS